MFIGSWRNYEKTFTDKGLTFSPAADLVGRVWDAAGNRPLASNNEVFPLDIKYAGRCIPRTIT